LDVEFLQEKIFPATKIEVRLGGDAGKHI